MNSTFDRMKTEHARRRPARAFERLFPNSIFSRSCLLVFFLLFAGQSTPVHAAFGDFLYKWGAEFDCQQVSGVAVDESGNVYVADTYNHRVQVFSNTGAFLRKWGTLGSGDGQFYYPYGIALDERGNVYVLDTLNNRVQVFDAAGAFLRKWGTYGSGDGQLSYPRGIAVDAAGNVYVVDTSNYRVQVFDTRGTFVTKWGSPGSDEGQFVNPIGIAVDSDGNVYVTDLGNYLGNSRVQVFTRTGAFLRLLGAHGSGEGQFQYPHGIAVDDSGNVYVADTNNRRIQVFSNTGALLRTWGTGFIIKDNDPNSFPVCLAVDSAGHVFVSDPYNDTMFVFDTSGTFIENWTSYSKRDGQFYYPWGIAVDGNGNVYVADTYNPRVQVFSSAGTFIRKWGEPGSGDGQFSGAFAHGIAVDNGNNVYITDMGNDRIQVFSNSGTFIRKWGSHGSGDGQFYTPIGIAVDSAGNVYVADANNDRVQVFSNSGTFIRKWGSRGSGDGQFSSPSGIAVGRSGNVYVTDIRNRRVQVFSGTGTFLRKFEAPPGYPFSTPYGIAVDVHENVYVGDSSSIYVFTDTGTFLGTIGLGGWSDGQLYSPYSLAVDANGRVFEADYYNNRIQVFEGYSSADTQGPVTTHAINGTAGGNGWFVSEATVSLTATDADSGVKEIHYSADGTETVAAGASVSFTISIDGVHSVSYYAVDNEGNIEAVQTITVNIDKTIPYISASVSPAPNGHGWNKTDVIVTFTCSDAVSGIASCTSPATVTAEGAGQIVTGTAVDAAGNEAVAPVTLNIDKTAPLITATVTPSPNAAGWRNTDVTVTFTCSDDLSGIASCPEPIMVTTEGANQTFTGTAVDTAGNPATTSVTLNIDKTPPALSVSVNPGLLWPPNHKMVTVTPSIAITDANPGTTVTLISATSNEPDNGLGDGDTANDIVVNADGTISLRAERSGKGSGRVYTITYQATDIGGNSTTVLATVTVPHDQH